ncbi:MAG: SUMF1/EgtB/PvdO family nonheme iron enzyme [Proteobacteria bacterium]|nr:SUMF1/EgtB/PvdO family nonheme iron enzyme [Pseudomonadota bacterium]
MSDTPDRGGSDGPTFGRYRLLSLLGKGGTARVYRALRPGPMGFGKEVALKIIEPDASLGDEPMVSLANEARLGCLLQHPNIVTIDEFDTVDGAFYIAMEYIDGWPLERLIRTQRLKRNTPMPLVVVVHILIAICDALDYAHNITGRDGGAVGIVHRDLKPANVMISRRGEVKVADFGTAKAATNIKETQQGYTRGTPAYMSPEQVAGKAIDARSDVFSFGALMYEFVTGEMAFFGENIITVMKQVMEGDVREARDRIGEVAPALEPVFKRCMQRDPMARYQSASTIAAELRRMLPHLPARPTVQEWVTDLVPELPVTQTGEFGWDPIVATRSAMPSPPPPGPTRPMGSMRPGPGEQLEKPTEFDLATESLPKPIAAELAHAESDFFLSQLTPDHEIRAQPLIEPAGRDEPSPFAEMEPLPPPPKPPPTRPPASRPQPPPARAEPPRRSKPERRPPPPTPPPTSRPKEVVAKPKRDAFRVLGVAAIRLAVIYAAVLFLGPGIPGETGVWLGSFRDWQVGLATGAPTAPPWASAASATVGDSSFVGIDGAKIRLGKGNMRSPPLEVPAFEIMAREVTVDEYRTACPRQWWQVSCPDWGGPADGQTGSHPAVRVTWELAGGWCAAQGWRLPAEAEWALAARGPRGRTYPWGNKFVAGSANYEHNVLDEVADDGHERTAPVGSFRKGATPEGVHDLSGNVSEWTADCWLEDLRSKEGWEAHAAGDCSTRTARGGSWRDGLDQQTALRRSQARPGLPSEKIGFRCVRDQASGDRDQAGSP